MKYEKLPGWKRVKIWAACIVLSWVILIGILFGVLGIVEHCC